MFQFPKITWQIIKYLPIFLVHLLELRHWVSTWLPLVSASLAFVNSVAFYWSTTIPFWWFPRKEDFAGRLIPPFKILWWIWNSCVKSRNVFCCAYCMSIWLLLFSHVHLLAGEDTFTGSSMYAGSPSPHLLQAITLNKYSLPSITSVIVYSWSCTPLMT